MSVAIEHDLSPNLLAGVASLGSIRNIDPARGWSLEKFDEVAGLGDEFRACLENDLAAFLLHGPSTYNASQPAFFFFIS